MNEEARKALPYRKKGGKEGVTVRTRTVENEDPAPRECCCEQTFPVRWCFCAFHPPVLGAPRRPPGHPGKPREAAAADFRVHRDKVLPLIIQAHCRSEPGRGTYRELPVPDQDKIKRIPGPGSGASDHFHSPVTLCVTRETGHFGRVSALPPKCDFLLALPVAFLRPFGTSTGCLIPILWSTFNDTETANASPLISRPLFSRGKISGLFSHVTRNLDVEKRSWDQKVKGSVDPTFLPSQGHKGNAEEKEGRTAG